MASQPQLSGPIHAVPVDDELSALREELNDLRDEFEGLRKSYERDRTQWAGILSSLQASFGGGQGTPVQESGGAPMPQSTGAWAMWKDRLPSGCGKIIDALLIQPLTMTQMIRACGMAYGTIKNNMAILKNNTLVEKDGERWKLKRL